MTDVTDLKSKFTSSLGLNLSDKKLAKEIGARIRGVREFWLCLNQDELAELLGASQRTVSSLERGETKRPIISIETFQSVFKEHLDFVLYGTRSSKYYAFSPFQNQHGVEFYNARWIVTPQWRAWKKSKQKRTSPNYKKPHIGESLRLRIKKENKEILEKQRMTKHKGATS